MAACSSCGLRPAIASTGPTWALCGPCWDASDAFELAEFGHGPAERVPLPAPSPSAPSGPKSDDLTRASFAPVR